VVNEFKKLVWNTERRDQVIDVFLALVHAIITLRRLIRCAWTDRGKPGSQLHLVCDGGGVPLTAVVTAANTGDTTMFQALVEDIPPV
jgi:Transposase DDE domain